MTPFFTNRNHIEHQLWMVQKQLSPDFLDGKHEWRRLFAEAWGTILLVLVAAGGGMVAAVSDRAVTLAFAVRRNLVRGELDTAWMYVMGPILGALIGVVFELILKGKPTTSGRIAAQGTLDDDDSTQTREQ